MGRLIKSRIREFLHLDHQDFLESVFRHLGNGLSEYCFSSLFLFRHCRSYEIIRDEIVFIKGVTDDGFSYLMPTAHLQNVDTGYLEHIVKDCDGFFPISYEMLDCFDQRFFSIEFNPADSDYIYSAEKLKTFSGKKPAANRMLMNRFADQYALTTTSISAETMPDALHVIEHWIKQIDDSKEDRNFQSCLDALNNFNELHLSGLVCYADGIPCGILIGRELPNRTFMFHFAKRKNDYRGAIQYMLNQFVIQHDGQFDTYNFKQDMGIDSYRKIKLSYDPDQILHKYRVMSKSIA